MNHWFPLLNIAGSVVLAAFGLYVWRVEPGNRRNQAFALFAVGFSLAAAISNVLGIFGLEGTLPEATVLRGILFGLGGIGAASFGIATVEPDRRTTMKWLAVPSVLALAALGIPVAGIFGGPFVVRVLLWLGFVPGLLGGAVFAVLLLAEDFRRPERSSEHRREWPLLAAALVLYPGFQLTRTGSQMAVASVDPSRGPALVAAFAAAVLLGTALLVVGEWIRSTGVAEASAAARNVALLAAGMGLVGLALALTDPPGGLGVPFLARTGAVLILGYGVLRHQMLGVDEKVEYGLSKTTVAGIFVAVFFAASEAAQVLFADFAGNELIGVVAAALLVFAISPLQRFADRFAAKAVPGGAQAGSDVEARYRDAVETALADGEITLDEERHLSRLAERLGIERERALELREQVEDEDAGGEPP